MLKSKLDINKISNSFSFISPNLNNFHFLKVVNRVNETQLDWKFKFINLAVKGLYDNPVYSLFKPSSLFFKHGDVII